MTKKQVEKEIQSIVQQLIEKYKPQKIVLFGSAAKGKFGPDSDLDLLIVKEGIDGIAGHDRYRQVSRLLSHNMAMDLLVYSPYEIKKRLYLEDPFIKNILKEGRVLYDS